MHTHLSLVDKYQPTRIADFIGLEKPKRMLTAFVANPYKSAWLFTGPSGVGKTAMAHALANELPGQTHKLAYGAKGCNIETARRIIYECEYRIPLGGSWRLVIVDEADEMTHDAYIAFLSILQPVADSTIFVFTRNLPANGEDPLERRFKSRCHQLNFSTQGLRDDIARHLERIWSIEAPPNVKAPNFEGIAKGSQNNIRDALNNLEMRLLELEPTQDHVA